MARSSSTSRGVYEKNPGSGVWYIRYADHHGRIRKQRVGTRANAKKAYVKARALVDEIKAGLRPESDFKDKRKELTLGQYIDQCRRELEIMKSAQDQLRFAKRWQGLIGSYPLSQVTAEHVMKRRTARLTGNPERGQEPCKPATVNREVEFLRALLGRAVREGYLEKNPLNGLQDLPEDNRVERILTQSEELRLAEVMEPEEFDLVFFATYTGARRGEIFSLEWPAVDLENETAHFKEAKAGSSRVIPLHPDVLEMLKGRFEKRRGSFVFGNSKGGQQDADNWSKRVWKKACDVAGVSGVRFHDLRHTFASRMSMMGQGGRVLSAILGHTSSKTTDRYAHHDPKNKSGAVSGLVTVTRRSAEGWKSSLLPGKTDPPTAPGKSRGAKIASVSGVYGG